MKKTLYMVIGSLLLFFVFAYIDEYESLILPLLKEEPQSLRAEEGNGFTEEDLSLFLRDFNWQLSGAYAASNPGKAWELPASPEIQRSIHDELVYNLSSNIIVDTRVTDLLILSFSVLSPTSSRVIALETTDRGQGARSKATIDYVIEKGEKGFVITSMEAVEGDGRQEKPVR